MGKKKLARKPSVLNPTSSYFVDICSVVLEINMRTVGRTEERKQARNNKERNTCRKRKNEKVKKIMEERSAERPEI